MLKLELTDFVQTVNFYLKLRNVIHVHVKWLHNNYGFYYNFATVCRERNHIVPL